jgi:cell division protein FtsW (lipid II flippase)
MLPIVQIVLRLLADGGLAWIVVLASLALCLVGVFAIDVATVLEPTPTRVLGPVATKQLVFIFVGLISAVAAAAMHYRVWGWASWLFLAFMLAFLVFVLIPFVPTWLVRPRNGARGWIDFGPIEFQPAELTKIAYVLALAWYLRYSTSHRTLLGLIPPALIAGVPIAMITLQPDFGTALLFIPVLFAVLVAAGAKLKHLAIIVLVAALAAPAMYPLLKPHQKARIEGLIQQFKGDTSADRDINMQAAAAQSLIGAGQGTGMGDPLSRAAVHYSRLPERHNDMVFAVIVNRWGFSGGLGVILLYFLWVAGALATAATIREPFARLTMVGFATFVAGQVFVNVGMNIGIVPIIGVTLPFISYGGSSMVTGWLMTGIILGIAIRRGSMPRHRSSEYAGDNET